MVIMVFHNEHLHNIMINKINVTAMYSNTNIRTEIVNKTNIQQVAKLEIY